MGIFGSSEENIEQKVVDSTGQVNNNIVVQTAHDTHHQMLVSEKLLMATYVIIGLEVVKLIICSYGALKRKIKKRYQDANK